MTKYLLNRILRSICSVVIVVGVVMVMIYSALDRNLIFAADAQYTKVQNNAKEIYCLQQWEKYGYVDYIPYADYLKELLRDGQIDQETYNEAVKLAKTAEGDSELTKKYSAMFEEELEADGYDVQRLDGITKIKSKKYKDGGEPRLYAVKDIPVISRLGNYLTGLITIDNIHYVEEEIEDRGLQFTWKDPAYGGEKFAPAIIGNGTYNKYLLYTDNQFPYIHQNLIKLNLGLSFSIR